MGNSKKALSEMNLIDSFIFSYSTENIQDAEFISRIIIERATGHTIDKVVIQSEKQYKGVNIDKRGIRLDLCVSEVENGTIARVYDIEPNTYKKNELFHRNRYYQALVDAKQLKAGKGFAALPDIISIWILSYDPFGENRMIYHVKNFVEENPGLSYNDGAVTIYLYTDGELGGSRELKELLRMLEDTRECNATDKELKELLGIVNKIKQSEEVGEQFMLFKNAWDYELEEECEKASAKASAKARIEGLITGIINSYREFSATDEQIIAALVKNCNLTEEEAREKLAGN